LQKDKREKGGGEMGGVKRAAISPEPINEFFFKDPTKHYIETKKSQLKFAF